MSILKKGVRELRVVLCNQSAHSSGVRQELISQLIHIREYILDNYNRIKEQDPELPFIVRECQDAQPVITARYDFGIEQRIYLLNASKEEVGAAVNDLVEQAQKINRAAHHNRF